MVYKTAAQYLKDRETTGTKAKPVFQKPKNKRHSTERRLNESRGRRADYSRVGLIKQSQKQPARPRLRVPRGVDPSEAEDVKYDTNDTIEMFGNTATATFYRPSHQTTAGAYPIRRNLSVRGDAWPRTGQLTLTDQLVVPHSNNSVLHGIRDQRQMLADLQRRRDLMVQRYGPESVDEPVVQDSSVENPVYPYRGGQNF
jgi:hypothetical protein